MNVTPNPLPEPALLPRPETPGQRLRREFVASKLALFGLALLLLAFCAAGAMWIAWLGA